MALPSVADPHCTLTARLGHPTASAFPLRLGFVSPHSIPRQTMLHFLSRLLVCLSLGLGLTAASARALDLRRPAAASTIAGANELVPGDTPEARCGTHVYTRDYIQHTLDTVTDLRARRSTAGESLFPRPFGDNSWLMIYPLLRTDEIYNGTDSPAGPDRIVVSTVGKPRYYILTIIDKNPGGDEDVKYYRTCEYLPSAIAALLQESMGTGA